jgi:hypothetical protein
VSGLRYLPINDDRDRGARALVASFIQAHANIRGSTSASSGSSSSRIAIRAIIVRTFMDQQSVSVRLNAA